VTDHEAAPVSAPTAPRRVVVAEDESLIRLDIVEILRDNGFDVVGEAGDGETAVQLATELRPDLVIMDVKMPQLDGISAAEKLSKNHIAPVVLLTAFSQKELVERASEAGALAYVVKPFTPNDLLPAIEIALARYEQIITLEAEVADMVERFETRKLVDRAKGLLNEKMGLSEPEAFRWIQKASMDRRLFHERDATSVASLSCSRSQEVGASLIMFVIRIVEQRRPCSSDTAISWTVSERPRWIGVHTPVTRPEVAERVWVALMSMPTARRPAPACRFAAIEPSDSPNTT
jgi:response regulator NasT